MIVLFLSLVIVYVILYQTKGFSIPTSSGQWDIQIMTRSGVTISTPRPTIQAYTSTLDTGTTMTGIDNIMTSGEVSELPQSITDPSDLTILSGTTVYFGEIEAVDKLGISYNYALKDDKNIFYIYLDAKNLPDFASISRGLGGSIYVMNTEQDILQNKLFGDKITFINLPEYKNKTTLMVVEVNNQAWLLQVDYTVYHQSKSYLKDLFID